MDFPKVNEKHRLCDFANRKQIFAACKCWWKLHICNVRCVSGGGKKQQVRKNMHSRSVKCVWNAAVEGQQLCSYNELSPYFPQDSPNTFHVLFYILFVCLLCFLRVQGTDPLRKNIPLVFYCYPIIISDISLPAGAHRRPTKKLSRSEKCNL